MQRTTALSIGSVAIAVAFACVSAPGMAQDIAKTAPKNVKVLLDNEHVRVLEIQLAPGEKTGMHSHPENVLYFMTDSKGKSTLSDGTSKVMESKAGEARWSEAVTHDVENVGKTTTKVLQVELKEAKK